MGADLILAGCPAPKIVAGDDVDPETVADLTKDVLRRRIKAMSDDAVILAVENEGYGFDYYEYDYEDGDDPGETAALIRADLVADGHLDCLVGTRRDVTILNMGGVAHLLTGGLSYGDDPTDAFKWVSIYAETGITRKSIRLGGAALSPLIVRSRGITVELGAPRAGARDAYEGGQVIDSVWREPGEAAALAAALDAVERLVLAHAVAGVDVERPAYQEGVEVVLDGICNQVAE